MLRPYKEFRKIASNVHLHVICQNEIGYIANLLRKIRSWI